MRFPPYTRVVVFMVALPVSVGVHTLELAPTNTNTANRIRLIAPLRPSAQPGSNYEISLLDLLDPTNLNPDTRGGRMVPS